MQDKVLLGIICGVFPNSASGKKMGNLKITNIAKYFTRMNIHFTSSTKHPVFSVQGI
jgi:hypothetical protein